MAVASRIGGIRIGSNRSRADLLHLLCMLDPIFQKGGRGSIRHISPSAVGSVVRLSQKTGAHAHPASRRINRDRVAVDIARMLQRCQTLSKKPQPSLMFDA